MQKKINRRDALRLGTFGIAATGLTSVLGRSALAACGPAAPDVPKMLLIFLRGGNDGTNTVIPDQDSTYSPSNRQFGTYIDTSLSFDLRNNFARLHPALAQLMQPYDDGRLVFLHRIGNPERTGSHFTDQQAWETGKPQDFKEKEGWVTRLVPSAVPASVDFRAATISTRVQQLFRTENPDQVLAHIKRIENNAGQLEYTLDSPSGPSGRDGKLRGSAPTAQVPTGQGLRGHYEGAPSARKYDQLMRQTGKAMLDSELAVGGLNRPYVPSGGATYPTQWSAGLGLADDFRIFSFLGALRDAIWLLKETELRIAAVEMGGYDTHESQGADMGTHADLLGGLAHGMRSVYDDIKDGPLEDSLLTLTLSEFGRTSADNTSGGTDHGDASVLFAMGAGVKQNVVGDVVSGVYNCDPTTWADGDLFSAGPPHQTLPLPGSYLARNNDFRTVLTEVFHKHFSVSYEDIGTILPEFDPASETPLNFL